MGIQIVRALFYSKLGFNLPVIKSSAAYLSVFMGLITDKDYWVTTVYVCACWRPTYDRVRQPDETVGSDGRFVFPHLVNQVNRNGLETAITGAQIDVVVLIRF